MSSMRFFLRSENPSQLKSFIDEALGFNIKLEQCDADTMRELSASALVGNGEWYEWYSYADWASFDHCLYVAVIEDGAGRHTGFLELHSACLDLELAGKPGRGLRFERKAFLEHLEKYKATAGWIDDEGHPRLPYPEDVVNEGKEPPGYLARFNIEFI